MPNTTETAPARTDWAPILKRLEKTGDELRKPESELPLEVRESLEAAYVDLQCQLPTAVLIAVRSRLATNRPLVASAFGARCGACNVAMLRGDHIGVLTGDRIVHCQHCGVVLFAGEDERRRVAELRVARERKKDARRT